MPINGRVGTFTRNDERAADPGHGPVLRSGIIAGVVAGILPMGLILSRAAPGSLGAFVAVTGEVEGVGVANTLTYALALAGAPVLPGTVVIADAAESFTDDGMGNLVGEDGGSGIIDYRTGAGSVTFAANPQAGGNITAGYTTAPGGLIPYAEITGEAEGAGAAQTLTYALALAAAPVDPGSVVATDGVETFTDDGHGNLIGSAGGSGDIDYRTGAGSITFAANPQAGDPITASYATAIAGVLDEELDTAGGNVGNYIVHGTVRKDALKVGQAAQDAPSEKLLTRLETLGIWAN